MDQRVSKALEGIKRYLSSPPILTKVLSEEDLYLYLLASPLAISATLVRKDSKGQKLVYYVSHSLEMPRPSIRILRSWHMHW